jgi:hypothetical protein
MNNTSREGVFAENRKLLLLDEKWKCTESGEDANLVGPATRTRIPPPSGAEVGASVLELRGRLCGRTLVRRTAATALRAFSHDVASHW